MKRKDIVAKLMKEGLSEKILAPMSDKQLNMLAKRLISEQIPSPTPNSAGTPTIPLSSLKTNPEQAKKLANAGIKFIASEELEVPKLGTEPKSMSDKELTIKKLKFKIEHEKDKKKVNDAKELLAKLTKKSEDKSLNEWVQNIVEKNYHPFTSKNEIMEMIHAKLTEQKHQEYPVKPEIEVDPDTETKPGVDPDDPFRDPHPGIDPNPKAKGKHKVSADDAKNKIINLLKKKL
jgi:hypothetical protein